MQAIAEQIYSIFDQLGYFAIFFGVMLDNAGFPVRGELVLLITGSQVAKQELLMIPVHFEKGPNAMTERITAWQCIGCGRIEGAQPCVGICEDRKTDFVYASDHDEVLAQLTLARRRTEVLAALVSQLAHTTPREGEWERTYRALQARARRTLAALAGDEQSRPT